MVGRLFGAARTNRAPVRSLVDSSTIRLRPGAALKMGRATGSHLARRRESRVAAGRGPASAPHPLGDCALSIICGASRYEAAARKAELGKKSFGSPLECSCYVHILPCHFVNRSRGSDERHGGDAGGRDWRGRCAGRSLPRARHPLQPQGETHLFFACIIRWTDRRASTPARDRSI
jgi:hypothetical protein